MVRTFKAVLDSGGPGADVAVAARAAAETPFLAPSRVNSIRLKAASDDAKSWVVEVEYDEEPV